MDRPYAVACDIATGTGSSNSVLSGGCPQTGEKLLEFVDPRIPPHKFAILTLATARWLSDGNEEAFIIWEANGPGRIFGDEITEAGARNIYYKEQLGTLSPTKTDFPGWSSTRETKLELLGNYRKAVESGFFINRSRFALDECREYVYMANGSVAHSKSENKVDPSSARENHGDRVIADALLLRAFEAHDAADTQIPDVPYGTFAARQEEHARSLVTPETPSSLDGSWY